MLPQIRLTRDEIRMVVFVLGMVLLGSVVMHYRHARRVEARASADPAAEQHASD